MSISAPSSLISRLARSSPRAEQSRKARRGIVGSGCAAHHSGMRFAAIIVALLTVLPGAARACSIPEDPKPIEEQQNSFVHDSYLRAKAMVEVVALQGSRRHRSGLVRVVRVLKGPIRRGQIFRLRSIEESMCGAGDFKRGSRGLILLYQLSGRLIFHGYLEEDYLRRLDRLGLRPLRSPTHRR